jgi:CubicO group peptidase (beta-lactamase class C family)
MNAGKAPHRPRHSPEIVEEALLPSAVLDQAGDAASGTIPMRRSCSRRSLSCARHAAARLPAQEAFNPIRHRRVLTGVSPEGIACGGWGLKMTTRDLARFGQFLLQEGRWNGKQLLSREWLRLAFRSPDLEQRHVIQSQTIARAATGSRATASSSGAAAMTRTVRTAAAGQLTVVMPDQDAVVSVHAGLSDMQAS